MRRARLVVERSVKFAIPRFKGLETTQQCEPVQGLDAASDVKIRPQVLSEALALSSSSVRKVWQRMDRDRSGSLDYGEMREVLHRYNIEVI